ncbi:MAG TPA: GNAT family N-acetyltransferase [Candidatus Paceibacterota bacterium]
MDTRSFEEIEKAGWDAFCTNSPDAWFRHTSDFIKLALVLEEGNENHSFAITNGEQLLAVVPLVSQTISDTQRREYALGGMTPAPYPALLADLSPKERESVSKYIFEEIDRRAKEDDISCARMFVDPLSDPIIEGGVRFNTLATYGFHDTSMATVCIQLSRSHEQILSGMSERRQRYIAAAERKRNCRVDIFDSDSITDGMYKEYQTLFFEAAGMTVGSKERWQTTLEWIKNGFALLAIVRASGTNELLAGHLVMFYKKRGYDVNSAIHPSQRNNHEVGMYMQWKTMLYMKEHGCTHYEIGWLWPPTISESVYSQKELAIAHSKSLFGKYILPVFRGEKYYDMEYLRERRAALTEQFIAHYGNKKNITE